MSGFGLKLAISETGFEQVGLIFSILSAAIITSMSVIGLNNHPKGDWRTLWRLGGKNASRLAYLQLLFFLYMFTLAFMVLVETEDFVPQTIVIGIGMALGFLIPFTFLVSLPIPIVLSNFKSDQMNQSIKNARNGP